MRLHRISADVWEIRGIPPFCERMLRDLPHLASLHDDALERLYPDPVGSDGPGELLDDWREHVRPGLEKLFADSRGIVSEGLASLEPRGGEFHLTILAAGFDAWLNVLNQARLTIAEREGFGEEDLNHEAFPDISTPRGMDLLRMQFYAHLQEMLLGAFG